MLDGRQWRGAGAAIVAGNNHVIGLGLGHTGGNGANAYFGHQFHGNSRLRIHVLQVVNELGQVFDGIDVVVWGRRDQANAGDREAQLGNVFGHLVAG